MSTTSAGPPAGEAVQRVLDAGRELSTAAVLYHSALAATQGLTASDEKSMDLIARYGPLTAGELARRSGLAPASVTGLVGRLERIGAVRRVKHPDDGRKVLIELDQRFVANAMPLFDELVALLRDLCARYDNEQLRTIATFMRDAAELQLRAARTLAAD